MFYNAKGRLLQCKRAPIENPTTNSFYIYCSPTSGGRWSMLVFITGRGEHAGAVSGTANVIDCLVEQRQQKTQKYCLFPIFSYLCIWIIEHIKRKRKASEVRNYSSRRRFTSACGGCGSPETIGEGGR